MGGSSLAPEVLRETFGSASGQPTLYVLDSTDPATILAVEGQIDLAHTLFVVASKSGGTIETLSHFKHFYAKVRESRRRTRASSSSRSPIRARSWKTSLARTDSATSSATRRTSVAATRRFPTSAWCPRRSSASISPCCSIAPDRWSRPALPGADVGRESRPLARRDHRHGGARRARQVDAGDLAAGRHVRLLGRAVDRREHWQRRQGHPAGRGRDAGRARRLRRGSPLRLPSHE